VLVCYGQLSRGDYSDNAYMVLLFTSSDKEGNCFLVSSGVGSRGGDGVLSYMGYIGMCGPKAYGFSAVLVINGVSILAMLVLNRVRFLYSSLELGMLFRRSYFFIIIDTTISKSPSNLMFRPTVSAATVINRVGKIVDFGHK